MSARPEGASWFGGAREARLEGPGVVTGRRSWQNGRVMQSRRNQPEILVLVT